MARSHWRFFLLRWHRRLGVVSALFVLLLVVTGVLLNHGHELGLDRLPLENPWLRRHYGLPAETDAGLVQQLPAGELRVHAGKLQFNGRALADCSRLVGVVEQQGQILAVCSNRLLLLTPEGELIDQADRLRGVPEGLSAVRTQRGEVLLRNGEGSFSVDLNDLSIRPLAPDRAAGQPSAKDLQPADLSWERVLEDLHSGRLFGRFGVWLMDGMAILFAILAVSGLVMAWRRPHRR